VCTERIDLPKSRSPEVIRDHPSSRGTGGARSTTLEVCRQGRSEIEEILTVGRQEIRVNRLESREFQLRVETPKTQSSK
jgi:hypothetical protein